MENNTQINPDQAAAALAFVTKISQDLVPRQAPEAPQTLQDQPGRAEGQEAINTPTDGSAI